MYTAVADTSLTDQPASDAKIVALPSASPVPVYLEPSARPHLHLDAAVVSTTAKDTCSSRSPIGIQPDPALALSRVVRTIRSTEDHVMEALLLLNQVQRDSVVQLLADLDDELDLLESGGDESSVS